MAKKSELFEIGLAAGIIGGLVAGILFAPENGNKSRKRIKTAIKNFNDEHEEEIQVAKKQITVAYDVLKYNIERQFRIMTNKFRAKKMRKAKELEGDYELN